MLSKVIKATVISGLLALSSMASATVIYDESVDGDALGDNGAGTVIGTDIGTLLAGTSTVIGSLPGGSEDDWYKFTIDTGFELLSIILSDFVGPGGNVGWAVGTSIIGDHTGPFDTTMIGQDLLNIGELGVIRPIGPGSYAFKAGTGTNFNQLYVLDFNVSGESVPEPATLALLGIGLAGIGFARKKKQN